MTISTPRFAVIGFGALGRVLVTGLHEAGTDVIKVYARPPADGSDPRVRVEAAGAVACESIAEAIRNADIVVAAVPAVAIANVAHECAKTIPAGSLFVDPTPLLPTEKAHLSTVLAGAAADYVDAAILGTVETEGLRVPILVSGPGAHRFAEAAAPLGLAITVLDGPPGRSSLVKLLRSVFMKGRDALILEMLLAARQHGVETVVLESIGGAGEAVSFPDLANRTLASLALYAERRADELATCAELLTASGVDPIVTRAGSDRLRRMAELGLRTRFEGERPEDIAVVLDALSGLR